jgi:hypothetical protein
MYCDANFVDYFIKTASLFDSDEEINNTGENEPHSVQTFGWKEDALEVLNFDEDANEVVVAQKEMRSVAIFPEAAPNPTKKKDPRALHLTDLRHFLACHVSELVVNVKWLVEERFNYDGFFCAHSCDDLWGRPFLNVTTLLACIQTSTWRLIGDDCSPKNFCRLMRWEVEVNEVKRLGNMNWMVMIMTGLFFYAQWKMRKLQRRILRTF